MDERPRGTDTFVARDAVVAHERRVKANHRRVRKAVDHNESELVVGNRATNLMQRKQRRGETNDTMLERVEVLRESTRSERTCQ